MCLKSRTEEKPTQASSAAVRTRAIICWGFSRTHLKAKHSRQETKKALELTAGVKSPVARVPSKAPVSILGLVRCRLEAGSKRLIGSKVLPPVFAARCSRKRCTAEQRWSSVQAMVTILCHSLSASHPAVTFIKRECSRCLQAIITWLFTLKVKASQSPFLWEPRDFRASRHFDWALLKWDSTKLRKMEAVNMVQHRKNTREHVGTCFKNGNQGWRYQK